VLCHLLKSFISFYSPKNVFHFTQISQRPPCMWTLGGHGPLFEKLWCTSERVLKSIAIDWYLTLDRSPSSTEEEIIIKETWRQLFVILCLILKVELISQETFESDEPITMHLESTLIIAGW